MGNALFKEDFVGKYDGVTAPTMLPPGSLSDGKNVRKVSQSGGWKPRKGCALNNTTAVDSTNAVDSLHLYENPLQGDRAFIAQCNSKLYKATNDPPASGTTFGSALEIITSGTDHTVGTTPGFSDKVGEWWFYADGSGRPTAYGGLTPFPRAVLSYDDSEGEYIDITRKVTDNRSDTSAELVYQEADKFYVITEEPISAVALVLGTNKNAVDSALVVKALRSGTLTTVSSLSDGTETGDATLAQDGTVSWTGSASDTPGTYAGTQGYVYEFSWTIDGAETELTQAVQVVSVKVTQPIALLTNKWHGVLERVTGCRFYDQSTGEYVECLGKISDETTSTYIDVSEATTSDFLYIKTPEPACGFAFAMPAGYENSADAQIDLIECLEGDAWTDISTLTDLTLDGDGDSSFSQAGIVSFDTSSLNPTRRTFEGDSFPGFWYRVSWDASLSADTRLYLVFYAAAPETLPAYSGCIEFKGRLCLWGDPEFPNKLRFSQFDKPFCFTGLDSGFSDPLGYENTIKVVKKFHNELLVWKEDSVWLIEGYNMKTFGAMKITDQVGCASPKSAQVVEVGFPGMHRDEPLMIAIWQDVDGIYVLDGRKPRKVSMPIDQYFNPEYTSTCISAANIDALDSFVDRVNNEYHLLLPSGVELVYNFVSDEWYPPWARQIALSCGLYLRGTDDRFYTYGGSSSGFVMKLETDTADKTTANADSAIEHYVQTRAISFKQEQGITLRFNLRHVYVEAKAQTAGTIVTTSYVDRATSGTTEAKPSAMSLINTGYSLAVPRLDISRLNINCFELKFSLNTVDQEMEIYSLVYEVDGRGLPVGP